MELAVQGETRAVIHRGAPTVAGALRRLRAGAPADALSTAVATDGDATALAEWYACLDALIAQGGVRYELRRGATICCTLQTVGPHASGVHVAPVRGGRWRLSRFAHLRPAREGFVLESPRSTCRVQLLHPDALTWLSTLAGLARGQTSAPAPPLFLGVLRASGLLVRGNATAETELAGWSFADAVMHWRSRMGRHDEPFGATYPLAGVRAPAAATKPRTGRRGLALPRPALARLMKADTPFTRVLESRRSRRDFGAEPIALESLGEFLFRAARVQRRIPRRRGPTSYAWTERPSPSGGASHSLELYLAVRHCARLAPGLYHYDPDAHRLEPFANSAHDAAALIAQARDSVPGAGAPALLVILASRFERVQWKYESMAYATILKDVGALLQTMYLVATAMGLAPCAVGGGDAERFAQAIGRSYFEESSVGEFLLGTRPQGRRSPSRRSGA